MKTILTYVCPHCKKVTESLTRFEIGKAKKETVTVLKCGHMVSMPSLSSEDVSIISKDGKNPFPYQITTAKFLEDADCNGLCLHEQGLGKTVIECLLLRRNWAQLTPALIVTPSGLRPQWFAEVYRWTGKVAQVITSSSELPLFELFDIFIVSVDTLRLLRPDVNVTSDFDIMVAEQKGRKLSKTKKIIWTDEILARFKHICVDEIQKVKNEKSSRTKALRLMAAKANDGQKARVIGLSGTPIEKHAGEYFVGLNLVRPDLFGNQSMFNIRHCEISPETGKIGGLKNPTHFKELTKDFIIRYRREEVLPDLPRVFRQFRLAEMPDGEVQAYIKVVKEFQDALDDPDVNLSQTDILGYLSRMRHITGVAKVDAACDFVEEFLFESERKLVIFRHHDAAATMLFAKLEAVMKEGAFAPPLMFTSSLDMNQRQAMIEEFKKPENRIMLASTQALGTGFNLQFCSDCLFMERQWNPSIEEQGEGRFPRPGSTADKINAHYLIAAGTVDDFLTDIIEQKRRNVSQTLDGIEIEWDEASLIGELSKAIQTRGLKRWKLA
jgi:SNF2 family DNA or RNA helicase